MNNARGIRAATQTPVEDEDVSARSRRNSLREAIGEVPEQILAQCLQPSIDSNHQKQNGSKHPSPHTHRTPKLHPEPGLPEVELKKRSPKQPRLHRKGTLTLENLTASMKRFSNNVNPKMAQVVRAMRIARRMEAARKKGGVPPSKGAPSAEPEGPPKGCCAKINYYLRLAWKRSGLAHCTLLAVIVIYAFIGGALFSWLEGPNEIAAKQRQANHTETRAQELSTTVAEIYSLNQSELVQQQRVYDLIREYQREENLMPKNRTNWDLWGAIFYAGTLFTTIGYGHYACQTIEGKIATMLYALVGIPLLLVTLQDLGKFLTKWLKIFWNNVCFCWSYNETTKSGRPNRRPRPPVLRLLSAIKAALCSLCNCCRRRDGKKGGGKSGGIDAEASKTMIQFAEDDKQSVAESENTTEMEEFDFPISIAIILVVLWFLLSSSVFCIWETNWTWFDGLYFFFVTLTTIGLGDLVPDHPKFMTAAFVFVIFGLSLVTMVINLIQARVEKLKEQAQDFVEDDLFGWDTESEEGSDNDENNTNNPENTVKKATAKEKPDKTSAFDVADNPQNKTDSDSRNREPILQVQELDEEELELLANTDVGYTVETQDGYRAILGIYQVPVQEKHIRTILRIRRGTQTDPSEFFHCSTQQEMGNPKQSTDNTGQCQPKQDNGQTVPEEKQNTTQPENGPEITS